MPNYIFKSPETGEEREVFQAINDEHVYVVAGLKWERVWTCPQLSMDTKIDPFSEKQFLDKTSKPGTIGDMWDRAADLQQERAAGNKGIDPLSGKSVETKKKKEASRDIWI